MKGIPKKSQELHDALMKSIFVGKQVDGSHNSVSLVLLLEQTYNALMQMQRK